jgi:hypothetical protein
MIEPQLKRGVKRDVSPDGRRAIGKRVVWRLYYFTNETWQMPATWTCDTKNEARWFAFTHQWARVGGAAAGVAEREIGRQIVESAVIA